MFNPHLKMYDTGDSGYWDIYGNLFFTGRNDSQIKFHGFRIELDEISQNIESYGEVEKAVVTITKSSKENSCLIAFIKSHVKIDENKLSEYMSRRLPKYMIPNKYIQVYDLPMTDNGKVNIKQLELKYI